MSPLMLNERLPEMLAQTQRLRSRFASTAPMHWDATTAAAELLVQLGHLAMCLLRQRGADIAEFEDPARPITNVGDELADVVLATLSICTLADSGPAAIPAEPAPESVTLAEMYLRLSIAVGSLAEAAMVGTGYRHHPTGARPSVPKASASVLAACGGVAKRLAVDLVAEFHAMVADADAFLDQRGVPS